MTWRFTEDSPLHNQTAHTPCNTIFTAVCGELARYFESQGARYARSRPKLTFRRGDLKLALAFWSSRSNIPGEIVVLEMIPSFYSLALAKADERKRGYFFGHPTIFCYPAPGLADGVERLERILKPPREQVRKRTDAVIRYSNTCNVYGLTPEAFGKIAAFIENRILVFFEILSHHERLRAYLNEPLAERERSRESEAMQAYLRSGWDS